MRQRPAWVRPWALGTGVAVLLAGCSASSAPARSGGDQPGTATVKRGTFVRDIRATGTTEAVRSATTVAPRLAGQPTNLVITRLVAAGARVRAGDLLVEFDRQDQVRAALERRAEYLDLEQQTLKKRADQAAALAADQPALTVADHDVGRARLDVEKNQFLARRRREEHAGAGAGGGPPRADEITQEITRAALALDATTLALLTPRHDALEVVASFNINGESAGLGSIHFLSENPILLKVLDTKKSIVIGQVTKKPLALAMKNVLDQLGTQTLAILPMISKGQAIGLVGLHVNDPSRLFSQEELTLAGTICSQITTAIENAQLFQDVQARVTQQEAVTQITEAALSASTIEELIREIHKAVERVLPARSFT